MTRLYLVRHGEAAGEGEDPALSRLGLAQSRLLGDRLSDEGAVEVRHSPRRRAVETAAVLGEWGSNPRPTDYESDPSERMPTSEYARTRRR